MAKLRNFMGVEMLRKLRRHFERTSIYEPLMVRPHPREKGTFEVVSGHNRLRVLRALKYSTARCIVLNLDDHETRLCLATVNRLSGGEVPERRANLFESSLKNYDVDDLADLLPDDRKQIEELQRLTNLDLDSTTRRPPVEQDFQVPVILSFMLEETDFKEVNHALDMIVSTEKEEILRSQALLRLARFFLESCRPVMVSREAKEMEP